MPALLATICAVVIGRALPIGGAAPLVVLSGLAVILAAGDGIALYHQRVLGFAWAGLLLVPAIFIPMLIVLMPWTVGTDLKVARPAAAMGRFFADSFERRTGLPLAVVTGDPRTAALVALGAPSRPSVFFDADPAHSPWVTADDIRKKGAVVVWLTADTTPTPPPDIKAYFPDLIPEVPRVFEPAGARPAAAVADRLGRDQAGQRGGGAGSARTCGAGSALIAIRFVLASNVKQFRRRRVGWIASPLSPRNDGD